MPAGFTGSPDMATNLFYELIGYAASILVAISLMMSAVVRLRIVNMIGAFTFSIYGILIGSIPVFAMNGAIVLINVYYLLKIYHDKEFFQLFEVDENSRYTERFLQFYRDSIKSYQPAYTFDAQRNFALFVLRDMVPAGLLHGNLDESGILTVDLDFVIPRYRDFKIGKYLFEEQLEFFRSKDIRAIRASGGSKTHNRYLEKSGFRRVEGENGLTYELSLRN